MKNIRKFALAMLCASGIGHLQAATYDINLNGVVSEGRFSSSESAGVRYDYWSLDLSSLDLPISVAVGDTVNATITFDQRVTMPASVTYSFFDFTLTGDLSPADTETQGTTTFFDDGVQGLSESQGTRTSGQLSLGYIIFPPNNGIISFDKVTSNFEITELDTSDASGELDGASIFYLRVTPVPEPETYAMLLAGLGLVITAVKRRKAWSAS